MALVIEDGSIVTAAVSYVTAAEAREFALARGVTLSADDPTVEITLIQAMDYLDRFEDDYKGERVSALQELPWPRDYVYLRGALVDKAVIPPALKRAQMQLAIDAVSGSLQPTGTGREIVKQKVDAIETEYAKQGSGTVSREFNKAHDFLQPLLKEGSGDGAVTLIRT